MTGLAVSRGQAANFLVARSLLLEPAASVDEVVRHLSCIQVDPINVTGRSHELALWNRVRRFRLKDLGRALYRDHTLWEYWQQLFSILPIESYPWMSARMAIEGDWPGEQRRRYAHLVDETLAFIRDHGPTSSRDLEHIEPARREGVWAAGNRAEILETLWDMGALVICNRQANQRYYDLAERVVPAGLLERQPFEKSREFIIRQHFRYVGLARGSFLNRVGYATKLALAEVFRAAVERGEAVPVTIDGVRRTWYVHADEADRLAAQPEAPLHRGLLLLPPLDPLVIDRVQLADVFGYEYTWEAYTPAAKRKFGYYGLPVLYNGRFVGQVDTRYVGAEQRVVVLNRAVTVSGVRFEGALQRRLDAMAKMLAARPTGG